jgi:precorrin-6A/cobalt-precorrin-6A reductase
LLRLERPAWAPEPADRWVEVANNIAAVSAIPPAARVLLTIGRKEVGPYFARNDITGIARMIEAMDMEVIANWQILLARPPFNVEEERRLLSDHAISHLVTKNSGGQETYAKLVAARMTGVAVIMIRRPLKPNVPTVADPLSALAFLDQSVSA